MTIHEIAKQLIGLSVAGYVGGEKRTVRNLEDCIKAWLRDAEHNKIPNSFVTEICLPDGRWLMTIDKHPTESGQYGYYIPETREQEARLKDRLLA